MQLKRTFLIGVVVSLSVSAALGIWAMLFARHMGSMDGKVLGTTLSVCLFSLTSFLASLVLERAVWRPIMVAGLIISGLGLLLFIAVIWVLESHMRYGTWAYELIPKTMGLSAVWAIALPYAGLLALSNFSDWLRWLRRGAILCVLLLAGLITWAILADNSDDDVFRAIGVLSILTVAGTFCVPILQKVRGIDRLQTTESTPLSIKIACPRCLLEQTAPNGHSRCSRCRLKFHIEIEEPRCPRCNYLLHNLVKPLCPECGAALSAEEAAVGVTPA